MSEACRLCRDCEVVGVGRPVEGNGNYSRLSYSGGFWMIIVPLALPKLSTAVFESHR